MRCASQLLPGLPPDAEICAESGSDLQDGKTQARELATWLVVSWSVVTIVPCRPRSSETPGPAQAFDQLVLVTPSLLS